MRIELAFPGATPELRRTRRPVPFLVHHFAGSKPNRLPSIRIPVTPSNRALLRELRAAEMTAWTSAFSARARRCEIEWQEEQ